MDTKIKEWMRLAQKISKYLLHSGQKADQEVTDWRHNTSRSKKILEELSRPDYYALQSAKHRKITEKYSWDNFVLLQNQKQQRRKIRLFRYAASIAILIAAGSAILLFSNEPQIPLVSTTSEIQPGSMKAVLILGNGEEMMLDNQHTFTEKDGTVIQNNESGELAYQNSGIQDTVLQYNTLRIPRGGEYRLILADGTKIWLNSESELIYPTQFNTNAREVFLKGEAYFEIAHNPAQPFYVNTGLVKVHATGTAFNITAYADDPDLQVTLTEGGVNIEEGKKILTQLSPNFQFILNRKEGNYKIKPVDPRTATAWKNGSFFFEDEPLNCIIRKLSRWYDVDISCDNAALNQYKFSGEVRKYENASKVLDMLKLTNEITYAIQPNQRIIIYPRE